ncbi:BQ2448_3388 [Microbotryum intermedium]|uniref:GPI inositol-deacylase n=1 Tax=Microbotryum intermedium TaxID=269621 RepID=A0A238FHU0_9BASI|nr:BQ2448_3388 [Microbotryum intermedium]
MVAPTSSVLIERTEPLPARIACIASPSSQVSVPAWLGAQLTTTPAAHCAPSHVHTDPDAPTHLSSPSPSPSSIRSRSKSYPRPILATVSSGIPSASTSTYAARHPDLSRPTSSRNAIAALAPSLATATNRSIRSASVGSLRSLLIRPDSDLTRRALQSLARLPLHGPKSRAESSTTLAPLPDTEHTPLITRSSQSDPTRQQQRQQQQNQQQQSDAAKGNMNALRWGHWWWPFSVVGPDVPTSTPSSATLEPDPEAEEQRQQEQTRSFLSYFAGEPTVDAVAQHHMSRKRADDLERDMLDLGPAVLAKISKSVGIAGRAGRIYREAEEGSPRGVMAFTSQSPDRPRSFVSNALEGPASLLSSFSIPNPFGPTQARKFSTPASDAQDSHKAGTDEDNIEPMLNQVDQEAVDDSHMDIYSVLKESYQCPKHPIVFCHGLFGFNMLGPTSIKPLQFSYWVGVKEALEGLGAEVMVAKVPASASIEERAKVLCSCIEERFSGKQVNLIGHSMGGLDGRFLITHLQPTSFTVRSLTTISTPHRGSSFADFMLEDVVEQQHLPKLLTLVETVGIPGGGRAFEDLTVSKMVKFNEETADREDVAYYSYGAEFVPTWTNVFRVPYGILLEKEGANDGLVSVQSAKWGDYQATLNNVNHLDLIGWVGKIRYGWAEWLGRPIKFKPVSFFCAVAEMLAEKGH